MGAFSEAFQRAVSQLAVQLKLVAVRRVGSAAVNVMLSPLIVCPALTWLAYLIAANQELGMCVTFSQRANIVEIA